MASGPIPSWEIDGETVETVSDFILGGFKITADGDCSHEIKRCLLLGRKVTTNLDNILKSRDITLSTKVCLVKAMVFLFFFFDVQDGFVFFFLIFKRKSILNPPPSSLPIPSLWVVPVHQPQASSIMHRTWTGISFHT